MPLRSNITASPDIALEEIDTASHLISDEAHPDATIIWGAIIDPSLEDEMRVTVIATGFNGALGTAEKPAEKTASSKFAASEPVVSNKQVAASAAKEEEEDDEYGDIFRILNAKK